MDKSVVERVVSAVCEVVKGKEKQVRLGVCCLLAGGHLLLEDLPGTGKTTFALALARAIDCEFRRIQFTSDLLPSDILGTEVYDSRTGEFRFRKGPVFTNVLLADEINRATPRTQSAFMEVMSEGKVSVSGISVALPQPFFIIATQNPADLYGTYPLPESQLDRFMMRLEMGYPDFDVEVEIVKEGGFYKKALELEPVIKGEKVIELREQVEKVRVSESVLGYIVRIGEKSRLNESFRFGLSTRALIDLKRASQAWAFMKGRDYVIPDDVKEVFPFVVHHRLWFRDEVSPAVKGALLLEFLESVPVPL